MFNVAFTKSDGSRRTIEVCAAILADTITSITSTGGTVTGVTPAPARVCSYWPVPVGRLADLDNV